MQQSLEQFVSAYVGLGADHTARELRQQPQLWKSTLALLLEHKASLTAFLTRNLSPQSKIVFTGAGSSEFIGNTVVPFLRASGMQNVFSLASTDLILAPRAYLHPEDQVLLISCARSGDSPESIGVVDIVDQLSAASAHIFITCNPEGGLARLHRSRSNSYLLQLEGAHDQGFAMTGSFTSMTLAAASLFRLEQLPNPQGFAHWASRVEDLFLSQAALIKQLVQLGCDRFIALGSAMRKGLAQEAQLKVLELSASHHTTCFDTPLGFRHGPKSVLNDRSLVLALLSENSYTLRYELDLLAELMRTAGKHRVCVITPQAIDSSFCDFQTVLPQLPDASHSYLHALAGIMLVQWYALENAIHLGVKPDNPSPSGSVNRVVRGVTIHPFAQELR